MDVQISCTHLSLTTVILAHSMLLSPWAPRSFFLRQKATIPAETPNARRQQLIKPALADDYLAFVSPDFSIPTSSRRETYFGHPQPIYAAVDHTTRGSGDRRREIYRIVVRGRARRRERPSSESLPRDLQPLPRQHVDATDSR